MWTTERVLADPAYRYAFGIGFCGAYTTLPLVVQFVDTEESVQKVLPRIREMAPSRLITIHSLDAVP